MPSILDQVQQHKQMKPLKMLIYGDNGVGKSTFCSQAPQPLMLDLEGNIDHLNTPKLVVRTFEDLQATLQALGSEEHDYQTVVVDSIDTLEQLFWLRICYENQVSSIEDARKLDYGRGYVLAQSLWKAFLDALDQLREKKKLNIILIGHAAVVSRVDKTSGETFERTELRIHKKAAGLLGDWCHCIAYAHVPLTFSHSGKKPARVCSSGSRLMAMTGSATFFAKNVYDLSSPISLDWDTFSTAIDLFFNPKETLK